MKEKEKFESIGFHMIKDGNNYDLYDMNSENIVWFGRFSKGKGKYVHMDNQYESISELVEGIRSHNDSLPFPAYTYNPNWTMKGRMESIYQWYTKKLGLKSPKFNEGYTGTNTMVMRNQYEQIILYIFANINDDGTGKIYRSISEYGFCESVFTDAESMIASINSILEPELLLTSSIYIKSIENMTAGRNGIKMVKMDHGLNVVVEDAKKYLIDQMEDALKRLKEE